MTCTLTFQYLVINENDAHSVVLSYLVHSCYIETMESFVASTGMKQPVDCIDEMEKRKGIYHCAVEGNALTAIELTEQLANDLPDTSLATKGVVHIDVIMLPHNPGGKERTEQEFEGLAKGSGIQGIHVQCNAFNAHVIEFLE